MKLIAPVLALVMLMLAAPHGFANQKGADSPERKALQAKFESRYPQIRQLKAEGKIGETSEGLIDAVKDADGTARKLIDDENRDRRSLYSLIAKDEGIDADIVARRAAKRNFEKAKKGEFLRDNGAWRQK